MSHYDTRLASLVKPRGDNLYHTEGWRNFIETYMRVLRESEATTPVLIQNEDAFKYEGDFYGLLQNNSVPAEFHWIVMRLNEMTHPGDYEMTRTQLLFPNYEQIRNLMSIYRTASKKIS